MCSTTTEPHSPFKPPSCSPPPPHCPSSSQERSILCCHKTSCNPINCNLITVARHWDCWVTALCLPRSLISLQPSLPLRLLSACRYNNFIIIYLSQSIVQISFGGEAVLYLLEVWCHLPLPVHIQCNLLKLSLITVPAWTQVLFYRFNRVSVHISWVFIHSCKVTDSQWLSRDSLL